MAGDFAFLLDRDPATIPCRNDDDPEMWFSDGLHAGAQRDQQRAKALCEQCPVKDACLRDALAREDGLSQPQRFGIYGGKDAYDRAELGGFRVCRPKPKHTPAECGTTAGYYQHRNRGEKACFPCGNAATEDQRRRKAQASE